MKLENEQYIEKKHRTVDEVKNYTKRLNRIEGQIKGITKMLEEERHCDDILIQISAVGRAVKSLGEEILRNHMKTCMVEDIQNKKYEIIDEIVDLYKRLI